MNNPMSDRNQETQAGPVRANQTLSYAVAGAAFGCAFPILATAITLVTQKVPLTPVNVAVAQWRDPLLWIIDSAPFFLGLLAAFAGRRQDALLATNEQLKLSERDLTGLKANLEQTAEERTHELEQRNTLMAALLSVTGRISGSTETAGILAIVVDQVPQYFGRLQASIFMLDQPAGMLVLRAASSDAGKAQLSQGYAVEVAGQDLASRAAAQGTMQTLAEEDETGVVSEIALPLSTRGRVIGVLDLQPDEPRPLTQHETETLRLLADQVAAALDSAHLLDESRSSVSQLQNAMREQTDVSWREYLSRQTMALQYTPAGVRPLPDVLLPGPEDSLRIPLAVRGWQIGSIALQRRGDARWTDDERDLVEKVALQVALAIDNNRLMNETRRRALHEQTVSELSARFNQTVEIDTLLRTAVREFASLPEVSDAAVILRNEAGGSTDAGRPTSLLGGYKYDNVRLEPINSVGQAAVNAMDKAVPIVSEPAEIRPGQGQSAAIPILLRGEALGVVVITFQRPRAPEGAIAMINQAADRLATALENARLLQESLRRADQERLLAEITSKIGSSISMRNVLQTAVEELGRAIAGSDVTIRLHTEGTAQAKESRP